jgi:hypothetical protein
VTHTIPLAAMPLLHHTRSVRRASGLVQTPFTERTLMGWLHVDLALGPVRIPVPARTGLIRPPLST